jgi:hypothetical protein
MSDEITQNGEEKGRFGLTAAEYADLKTAVRLGMAIFGAVAVALIVVAVGSSVLGG